MMRSSEEVILQKLEEVSRKQDRIPDLISDVERRQRADLDTLRRDFERMFVSHAEYDPKHQVLLDKVKEYDQIVSAGRNRQDEYVKMRGTVEQNTDSIEHMKSHSAGLAARIIPWISLAIATAAVLLSYAQHITIR